MQRGSRERAGESLKHSGLAFFLQKLNISIFIFLFGKNLRADMRKKKQSINCLRCFKKNDLKHSILLTLKASPLCSECQALLFPHYEQAFAGMSSAAFIHKLDSQMLEALKAIPGIDTVLRTFLRHSFELSMRLHHQGNFIQVSKLQLASLYGQLEYAAHILDMPELPELYVVQDARANAYTFGVKKCSIALSSACLDLMSKEEILAVLAHELGHIKAQHVLYKTASRLLATLADGIAQKTFGLGSLILMPMKLALLRWDRASELSSDRAALLVVKNPTVVLTMLMKLAGGSMSLNKELSIKAFIAQAESYEKTQDEGPLGSYIAIMNSMFNAHPFPIWRARELIDWVKSGEYAAILQGNYAPIKNLDSAQEEQKRPANIYTEKLDQGINSLRSWVEKNLNPPDHNS